MVVFKASLLIRMDQAGGQFENRVAFSSAEEPLPTSGILWRVEHSRLTKFNRRALVLDFVAANILPGLPQPPLDLS